MLIKIEAIINEEKFQDVLDALNAMHVNGITVSQVMGCGTQHGLTRNVRGSAVEITLLPKIKLEIVVSSEKWEEKVIQTIRQAASAMKSVPPPRSGQMKPGSTQSGPMCNGRNTHSSNRNNSRY